jgi:HPt (histidine-containing phosphotransfer) domain-containing protein
MKASTVHELKDELKHLSVKELVELCNRLARFKKENKELLTYLLFEAHDEKGYIQSVKNEVEQMFAEIPKGNSLYLQKKSIRKILRTVNKYIRYSGIKTTEVELLLHFCNRLGQSGIKFRESTALSNLFESQIKKANKQVLTLHEDLQYDYLRTIEDLQEY